MKEGVTIMDDIIDELYSDIIVEDVNTINIPDPMDFGFKIAKGWEDKDINLPARATFMSAGYDLEAAEDMVIPPMIAMQQEIVEAPYGEIDTSDMDNITPVTVQQIFLADNRPTLVPTGLKCHIPDGMVIKLFPRSSLAYKRNLTVANNVGIIDADYYENDSNDGHIMVAVINRGTKPVEIKKGERIAQAILESFLVFPSEEVPTEERQGGIGSTDEVIE